MNHCVRIIVKGQVQGVYYRAHAQKQAEKLNITGYVKNLHNGDVEVIAIGARPAVEQMASWCRIGPLLARVTEIIIEEHQPEEIHHRFTIL
jgi:acylphosphatase